MDVRVPLEWKDLTYEQQKAVCKWMQEEALDMLAEDDEDHDFAAWLEAAAHYLGRKATQHERSQKRKDQKRAIYRSKLAQRFPDYDPTKYQGRT